MLHSEQKIWSRSLGIGESGRKNKQEDCCCSILILSSCPYAACVKGLKPEYAPNSYLLCSCGFSLAAVVLTLT